MQMHILILITVHTDMISIRYQNTEKWQYLEIIAWIHLHSLKANGELSLILYFMLTSRFIIY